MGQFSEWNEVDIRTFLSVELRLSSLDSSCVTGTIRPKAWSLKFLAKLGLLGLRGRLLTMISKWSLLFCEVWPGYTHSLLFRLDDSSGKFLLVSSSQIRGTTMHSTNMATPSRTCRVKEGMKSGLAMCQCSMVVLMKEVPSLT